MRRGIIRVALIAAILLALLELFAAQPAEQRLLRLPVTDWAITPHPWLAIVPRAANLRTLNHEWVHAQQQRRDGWLLFHARYVFSKRWRERYETEAAQ